MSLESLFGKEEYFPRNLKDFGNVPEYISRYRSLKKIYYKKECGWMFNSEESGAWIANIWTPDEPRDWDLPTSSQLLGVIAESLDDSDIARMRYEDLKQSDFFTKERVSWNSGYLEEGGWMAYDLTPQNQFIGILAEACFDLKSARGRSDLMKISPLYDAKLGEWQTVSNYSSRSNQRSDVALPLVVEGLLFDKDDAKKKYEKLKTTQIGNGQGWLDVSREEGSTTSVHPLLLGLLLEAVFDRNSAKKYLDLLKETPLYDSKNQLWERWWKRAGKKSVEVIPKVCDSDDQLLGVIIESIIS